MAIDLDRERFVFALAFAAANNDNDGLSALGTDLLGMDHERAVDIAVSTAVLLGMVLRQPQVDTAATLAGWAAELAAAEPAPGGPP